MRPLAAAGVALAVAAVGGAAGCGGGSGASPIAAPHDGTVATASTRPTATVARPAAPTGDPVAHVVRATTLRATPGGRVIARIGPRTGFGQPRYVPVVRRRGSWLGVIATERPNGRIGWIPAAATKPLVSRQRLVADLSQRRLRVLEGARVVLSIPVAVGAPATPTPTGRFGVTDSLVPAAGSPYGCCILALSGHQPHVPQGWTGGDRIAIHGTSDPASIGRAASSGCLRASDRDLRRLLDVVGLGAVLRIRA
jgi:lipoprotein-anchoring transpeptidase ErfK/SrfK